MFPALKSHLVGTALNYSSVWRPVSDKFQVLIQRRTWKGIWDRVVSEASPQHPATLHRHPLSGQCPGPDHLGRLRQPLVGGCIFSDSYFLWACCTKGFVTERFVLKNVTQTNTDKQNAVVCHHVATTWPIPHDISHLQVHTTKTLFMDTGTLADLDTRSLPRLEKHQCWKTCNKACSHSHTP